MVNKTFKTIQVETELKDKIRFLSNITGQSQNEFLNSVISPLIEIGICYKNAQIESYPMLSKGSVHFQFYGASHLYIGKVSMP